ncbi:calcium/proton exchanger [Tanacetum coccineum]|uniref:Calcium/proton exchanger n=1 Tax=Tanacetum coccineum TaxID=301880 RepID=A0ABQ5AFP4_9ASTR
MGDLNVTLHHDGVFVPNPLKYVCGFLKILNDIRFEEMQIGELFEIINRLVLNNVKHIYYCLPDNTLTRGIRKLKKDIDMVEFIRIGYENDKQMDLFIEHDVYDVLEYTANDNLVAKNLSENEELNVSDYDGELDPQNVDFHTKGEKGVHFERLFIDDPFLTKLVGNENFIGARSDPMPFLIDNYNAEEDGSEVDIIDLIYKKKLRKTKKRIKKRVNVKWVKRIRKKVKCKRAKQFALYEHENGLIEHYNKLWEYRNVVLESNLGSTCHIDQVLHDDDGQIHFSRLMVLEKTVILDAHKGLIEAVKTWLPQAEHRNYNRHIYENFKKKWSVAARGKPIITMLEDIRVYAMQRHWIISKQASELKDNICPSIMKQLELLKKNEVCSSGYQVLEVRRRDESYKVNQIERGCFCKLWDLFGILCMHVVAVYMHLHMDLKLDVEVYSKHTSTAAYHIKDDWKAKEEEGHNKQTCTIEKQPKPQKSGKPPSYKQYSKHGTGSNIGRGGGIVGRIGRSNSKIGGGSVGRGGGSSSKIGSRSVCRGGGSNMGKGGGSTTSRGIGSSGKRGGRSVGRGGGSNMGRGCGSNSKRGSGSTTSRGSGSSSKRGGGSNSKRGGMKRGW